MNSFDIWILVLFLISLALVIPVCRYTHPRPSKKDKK